MYSETKIRSWIKSLVWRLFGFVILGSISYIFTGSWSESLVISFTFNIIRFVLYYFHERMWVHISWGKIKDIEYEI